MRALHTTAAPFLLPKYMTVQKIGLAAVMQTSNLTKGVKIYLKSIDSMKSRTAKVTSSISSQLAKIGTAAQKSGATFNTAASRWVTSSSRFVSGASQSSSAISSLGSSFSKLNLSSVTSGFTVLGDSIFKVGKIAGGTALAGVTAFGIGLAGVVGAGVTQAASLDDQMAQIAATMGKTKTEVDPLKNAILDLSIDPNLKVSATEAANAVELLARNGLDMEQILGGAARSTVALSNATKADFGTAADIATDVMAQFNKSATEMGSVIDGITGVTTNSKFTIDDYGLAIAQAGGVSSSFGVDLTDFNTVLAATSANFKSGSDAGTSFKSLLGRLANPTNDMIAAMDKYGISLFDAEGNMRSMGEIAGQLNTVFNGTVTTTTTVGGATAEMTKAAATAEKKMGSLTNTISEQETELKILQDEYALIVHHYGESSNRAQKMALRIDKLNNSLGENRATLGGYESAISAVQNAQAQTITSTKELTEAEKANLATVIGGADASRIVLGLAKLNQAEFEALSNEVNASGQAYKSAATRVDSLKGALEIARSIIQGNLILIGTKFLPVLQKLTGAFAEVATKAGPTIVAFFGDIATRFENFIGIVESLISGGISPEGFIQTLGLTPQALELIDKFSAVITDVGGIIQGVLTPALDGLSSGGSLSLINQGIEFLNQNFDLLAGGIAGIGVVLAGGVFAALATAVLSLATPINLIIVAAAALGAAWNTNFLGIRDVALSVFNVVGSVIGSVVGVIVGSIIPSLQTAFNNIGAALSNMGITWGATWNALATATQVVATVIGAIIVSIIAVVVGLVNGIAQGLATATGYWAAFQNAIALVFDGIAQNIAGFITIFQGIVDGDLSQIGDGFVLVFEGTKTALEGIFLGIVTIISSTIDTLYNILLGLGTSVRDIFKSLYDDLVGNSIVPDMVNGIIDWFFRIPEGLTNALGGLGEMAADLFGNLFGGGGGESAGPSFDLSGLANSLTSVLPSIDALNLKLSEIGTVTFVALTAAVATFATTSGSQLATVLLSVQTVDLAFNNITLITIPLLLTQHTLLTTMMIEQYILVHQHIIIVDTSLLTVANATLPALMASSTATTTAMVSGFTAVNSVVNALIALLGTVISKLGELEKASKTATDVLVEGMKKAKDGMEKAERAVEQLVKKFEKLEAAARRAAEAARDVANASSGLGLGGGDGGGGAAHGLGFARGTGALGFKVPPGFPNDSFPLRVQSGEEVLVTPAGTTIADVVRDRLAGLSLSTPVRARGGGITQSSGGVNQTEINYNFSMDVHTGASPQGVIQQYSVMKALLG